MDSNTEWDGFRAYLEEAGARRPSSPAELEAIVRRAHSGDQEAKKQAIEAALADTADIAVDLKPERLTDIEAVQEANLILMRLIESGQTEGFLNELRARIRTHFESMR